MTCIAGIADGTTVWLAGDSAGITGWNLTIRSDPKVFVNGPYVIGFTDSFRMGQLLCHAFDPPVPTVSGDLRKFMATAFVDAVRECLKEGGWAKKKDDREDAGTFLVGVRGCLFLVDDDYQVGEFADGYGAVGCGDQVACGALHATAGGSLSAETRLRRALAAAEHHSAGVRGPFVVERTPELVPA